MQVQRNSDARVSKSLAGNLWVNPLARIWVAWLCLWSWKRIRGNSSFWIWRMI